MFNQSRKSNLRYELDRNTWAGHTSIAIIYDTVGTGAFLTEQIDFGVRFSGPPYVSQGQEMLEVGSLVNGDYPHVTVGVAEWIVKSNDELVVRGGVLEHIGAKLWIAVSASTAYAIRHRIVFDGIAMKTPVGE